MNKISVIVPFFNAASTLDKCIKSILKQTYKNFELLLIDDASTDNSFEVANKYTYIDRRVKVQSKVHAGVSAARNYALSIATGDLIQCVDADDYIEPEMFETMVTLITKENADIAVCNHDHPCIHNHFGDTVLTLDSKDAYLTFYQSTFAALLPWNKLWRREAIKENFDETTGFCEDDLFFLSNMKNAKKVVGTSKVLYHYYVAPYTCPEDASCIIKMAKAPDFWQTKNTFWYMRRRLLERSKECLAKYFHAEDIDDFAYTRIFDFVPVEIVILGALDVDEYGLTREMQNIFSEEDFHKSLRLKEKYGVKFTAFDEEGRNERVARFVNLSLKAVKDIRDSGKELKMFFVVLDLFTALFLCENGELNTVDFAAKALYDIKTLDTKEAEYVSKMI